MAVLGRLLVSSAERLDLPDFLSIDSYTQGDFKYMMRSFVGGDKPYILTGFDVINPSNAIGTQNISVRVADSVTYYPGSLAGPFFHGLEEGNTLASPLVPELRKNSTNYVYLTLTTTETAADTRAFWDPDKEGGVGGEFTQDVNTQTALTAAINVSVSAFPENTVPVCKVVVGANFITSIEDARDMMFRLGSGGLNPNPLSTYAFRSEPSAAYSRSEPNTLMSNALDPNAFQGGDKNIQTLKEWMDVVMTKLLELSGTTYWYEDTASFSLVNMFKDMLSTSIKSKGVWQSSDITPGLLTWTEDIVVQSVSDKKDIYIRSGNKTLLDGEVLYVDQNRGEEINTGSIGVEWFNSVNYVNGALGTFENLTKGDWVKKADDPDYRYLRVEEFYAGTNLSGGVTAAGNALSIKLSDTYGGISETKQGIYVQGEYLISDIQVGTRSDIALTNAGGDLYWLAMRSDKILGISDLTTTTMTIDIENHDGVQAKCTQVAHGLLDKQQITVAGSANFNGTYQIEVVDVDSFYIQVSGGPFADELAQAAHYATITTSARSTLDGFLLESAGHGLDTDQKVIVSDTTNYNGTHQVFVLTDTTFTVPVSTAIANESSGTTTSVDVYIRTDLGPTKLNQGENKAIGEVESENIMSFIGMDNVSQTYPTYHISPTYNTLDSSQNFNSDITDSLTQRVSKLTAMMADKAQDKTIQFLPIDSDVVTNTANVGAQEITFASLSGGTPTLNVQMLGSDNNGTLDLSGTISLNTNQVAYFNVDRNDGFTLASPTVVNLADMVVGENVFVVAVRLTDSTVYLWDGNFLDGDTSIEYKKHSKKVIRQNVNLSLIKGDSWAWDLGTNTLSWGTDAYIQVPGLAKERNTIQAGNILLTADGQIAYVDINRATGVVSNLAVTAVAITAETLPNPDRIVIAERVGDDVLVRGNKLALGVLALSAYQNVNLKLVEGGVWSWEAGAVNELINSADAYVQIPGLTKERNTVLAQTISLANDDEVAYVSINRDTGVADNLTVTVADEAALVINDNLIIIARRVDGEVIVGTSSFALKSESFLELDGALAEIDRYHGQLRVSPERPVSKRVKVGGSDIAKLNGSQLSLEQKNLLLAFAGAVINFETGEVFETDGTTPFLAGANDFTPFVIGANEYFYYSVSVLPNTANADNTISGQILVIPGASSDAVLASAPRAPFPSSGLKLANVLVQEDGAAGILAIDYANITQLGVGGGSGGSGNANADLTRYQDRLNLATFEYANTNIAEIDEASQLDGASTAAYDIPSGNFKFLDSTAQVLLSTQQLDVDFLAEEIDISTVELYAIWDLDTIDTGATYEVSRDGTNFQALATSRIGNSDAYRSLHTFTDEPSNAFNQEYAVANADSLKDLDDASIQEISQKFTIAATTVYKNIIAYINKNQVTSTGRFCVEIIRDDSGAPSTDINDIVWTSPGQNIDDLAVGNNVVNISCQFVAVSGDYHMIVRPDDAYRAAYTSDNNDKISVRMDSSAGPVPNLREYNGTIWSAEIANETAVYRLEGRVLDVRVRITSAATANDKYLSSYALFYGIESGIEFTNPVFLKKFRFDGTVDNDNEFIIDSFLPDSRLLMCFALGTGQVFRYGDFVLDGHKVIFPPNTFNVVGEVRLEFFQMQGVGNVASVVADALLTANHAGSTDPLINKSLPGRGWIFENAAGDMIEVGLDEFNQWTYTIVG